MKKLKINNNNNNNDNNNNNNHNNDTTSTVCLFVSFEAFFQQYFSHIGRYFPNHRSWRVTPVLDYLPPR
jgi:hypothetical protein